MKPLNNKEVKKAFSLFAIHLFILLGISVLSVFFLFQTRKVQSHEIANQLDAYDAIQNKQLILNHKIDSILYDISLLNSNKIQNSIFLQNRIAYEKVQIEELMQSADSSHFLLYRKMMSLVNPMLVCKDSINSLFTREDFLKKSLLDCMHKYNDTKRKVDYNPVRFRWSLWKSA